MPEKEHRPDITKSPPSKPNIEHGQDERGPDALSDAQLVAARHGPAPAAAGAPRTATKLRARITERQASGEHYEVWTLTIGSGSAQGVLDGMPVHWALSTGAPGRFIGTTVRTRPNMCEVNFSSPNVDNVTQSIEASNHFVVINP